MILSGHCAGAQELARFRGEVEAVARLSHPHIVQIYEVGEHDGRPFFAMEHACGGTLATRLRQHLPQPQEAAALVEQLARALHAVHQCHVVHRDLKPANVLLAVDGTPKVSDFGLSKRLDANESVTGTGAGMGTPSYVAPEQASGATQAATPLADIYSLGAILYECLTGRPPFRAATAAQTLRQVLEEEPVPPRRLNPALPRDLETISLKCLRKEPGQRYASAAALADDLKRFQAGEPIVARPVGWSERIVKWARRRKALAAVYGLLLLTVVLGMGGGGAVWLWQQAEDAKREAKRLSERLQLANDDLDKANSELDKSALLALLALCC
jgi:serine/threonine protein kinase